MSEPSTELLNALASLGREASALGARRIADVLEKCTAPGDLEARLEALPARNLRNLTQELVRAWENCGWIDGATLALALTAAQTAGEREREAEVVELVWTGPKTEQVPVARNDEALLDLVSVAEREVLLVTYATYQVPRLVERLDEAIARGVTVDLILEFYGSDGQIDSYDPIRGLGVKLRPQIRVWHWPPETRIRDENGRMGYIHVKCAVADGKRAFVSSANLTAYAMELNMELGVMIVGGSIPSRILQHFRELIRRGTLVEYQPIERSSRDA